MEENSLSIAFGESLKDESVACISELVEVGLDTIMEDGLFKDIPIISTAISVYKIGSTIKDRHNIKKLILFLNEINNRIADEEKRAKYQQKFHNNENFRNKELEYILIFIDRYISEQKSGMLARLYLAYLDEKITLDTFLKYAEVIDRFLPGDYEVLCSSATYKTEKDINTDAIQRLIALGLIIENIRKANIQRMGSTVVIDSPEINDKKERNYSRTEFGGILVSILS